VGPSATTLPRAGAGAALALGAIWLAPWASAHEELRRRFLPRLAGWGPPGQVALTFDDGPDPVSTPRFLAELDALGWRATFFLLGDMVRRAPHLAAEIVAAGHEVAVHGDHHRSHLFRTPRDLRDDVARARDAIAEASGVEPVHFRPPYGSISAGTILAARAAGLRTVLWSGWGRDWTPDATAASVHAHLRDGLKPGATLLLHDSDCTSAPGSWRSALGALPMLAPDVDALGVSVVSLTTHLARV
jgi:peptidoglycan/xylan/chitin deacetylase (PgdA/CDA1 family)